MMDLNMALFFRGLPKSWRATLATGLMMCLVACGGSPAGLTFVKPIKLEDGPIYGAIVVDLNGLGRTAVQQGAGIYQFYDENGKPVEPRLPVAITSQNLLTSGVVNVININGVWYSYLGSSTNPSNKKPLTFQDLDGDGNFTQGVDVLFNGAFNVNYAPANQTQINANPVTALIPAGWNGTDAIAGISKDTLKAAISTGVQSSANTDLKKAAALITAITDTLAMNGTTTTTIASVVTAIAAGPGVNLLASGANLTNASTSIASAVAIVAGSDAGNIAHNLQTISGSVGTSGVLANSNYEAIVQVAQANIPTLKTNPASANLTPLLAATTVADSQIEQGQTNASTGNTLSSQIAALRVVPFCDLVAGTPAACDPATIAPWLAYNRLTGFGLSRQADGSITLTAGGVLLSGFALSSPLSVPYDSVASKWIYKSVGNSGSVQISVGTGFVDPNPSSSTYNKFVPGNLMQICNSLGNCAPYYLATKANVCSLVTTNNMIDQSLLAKINALQASDRQVSCP